MLLFLLRSLLCQGPRVLWKVLLSPYCPSFPHQRLKTVGKPHLANCFLSLHPNLKKKRKLFVPEREVGGIVCAICTYWSATPFHLLQGCSTRPFSKETHRGRCVLCWVCVCVCVCVCVICAHRICFCQTAPPPSSLPIQLIVLSN